MDDNGVTVLAWCPNCALPVRVVAAIETRCPVCEDPGYSERGVMQTPQRTRSIEDLV
jgi:hypothetical protein